MKKLILKELKEIKSLLQVIVSNQEQSVEMIFNDHFDEPKWNEKLPIGDINNPIPQCMFSKEENGL